MVVVAPPPPPVMVKLARQPVAGAVQTVPARVPNWTFSVALVGMTAGGVLVAVREALAVGVSVAAVERVTVPVAVSVAEGVEPRDSVAVKLGVCVGVDEGGTQAASTSAPAGPLAPLTAERPPARKPLAVAPSGPFTQLDPPPPPL